MNKECNGLSGLCLCLIQISGGTTSFKETLLSLIIVETTLMCHSLASKGASLTIPLWIYAKFGYARSNGPHDMIIRGIVFDYENDSHRHRRRFIHAWGSVYRIESNTLGQWNSIPMEPYLKWVRTHAQKLLMPYPAVLPVTIEPEVEGYEPQVIPYPDMPTDIEELQKSWVQLKEERDTFKSYCQDYERRILELTGQLQ